MALRRPRSARPRAERSAPPLASRCFTSLAAALFVAQAPLFAQGILREHFGVNNGALFGFSATGVGDIDLDGVPDYAIGAPNEQTPFFSGAVSVFSGRTGDVLLVPIGQFYFENFGFSVAPAGDFDLDGVPDLVVGAPFYDHLFLNDVGRVAVISGATGLQLLSVTGSVQSTFGYAVAGGADLDGNGTFEIVVGARLSDTAFGDAGEVTVLSGPAGQTLWAQQGDSFGDEFGAAVAVVGDLDGDGLPDVVAGAPLDDSGAPNSGSVVLLRGLDGGVLAKLPGDSTSDRLGEAVCGMGDVDGDGIGDFAAGAPFDDDNGANCGAVRAWSGQNLSVLFTRYGDAALDEMGRSLAGGADLDGDGLPDLLVGIPFHDGGGSDAGAVRVFDASLGQIRFTLTGPQANGEFGRSAAIPGDLNLDGLADLLAGAPEAQNGSGVPTGLAAVATDGCGAISAYGSGCGAGTGGVPSLAVAGCAAGGASLTISIASGPPGGQAFLFHGTQQAGVPLGGGCLFLVGPVPGFLGPIGPLPLDGGGGHELSESAPAPMPQATVTLQAFIPAAVPTGFLATNGVQLDFP